jgi:inward rectifier potassium channel
MGDLAQTRVFGHSSHGVVVVGLRKRPLADVYHRLVTGSWTRLCVVYAAVYFGSQLLFEAAHLALGSAGAPRARATSAPSAVPRGAAPAEPSARWAASKRSWLPKYTAA